MSVFHRIRSESAEGLYQKHNSMLRSAIEALHTRAFFAQFNESAKAYGEEAEPAGKAAFEGQLGQPFDRLQQTHDGWLSAAEASPYTTEPLGISYPYLKDPLAYIAKAQSAGETWKRLLPRARAGILLEALSRLSERFFEVALATQHTTGQAYMMAFQAAGPHAADRALEAIALGYQEQTRFPDHVNWQKPTGKTTIHLDKQFLVVPKGVALAIGCSTFPIWNSLPGIFASLVTGNPVIVKPHPLAIYPLAIPIAIVQQVLVELGLSPDTVQLATDTPEAPITKVLAEHPAVKIIDFTGSNAFGDYIEALPGKATFTEKAGVNSVIVDSTDDLEAMAQNIGFSLCLYSGQMCTAPQNIYIPKDGILVKGERVPYAAVAEALTKAVAGLATHPKAGPAVLGAIQNPATADRIAAASGLGAKVLLESQAVANPDFPNARTASPMLLEVGPSQRALTEREHFGPIAFVVPTESTQESIALATQNARAHGAISAGAYTTNPETLTQMAEALAEAGVTTSFNLTGGVYINQNAAFSDLHVSGANPAGNASLTNPEFVLRRFTLVGVKLNMPQPPTP